MCNADITCYVERVWPSSLQSWSLVDLKSSQKSKNSKTCYHATLNCITKTYCIIHEQYIFPIQLWFFAIFIMWQLIINEISNFIISDAKRHLTCSLILFCKNAAKIRYCIRYVFCIIHVRVFTCLHLWKDVHFRSS